MLTEKQLRELIRNLKPVQPTKQNNGLEFYSQIMLKDAFFSLAIRKDKILLCQSLVNNEWFELNLQRNSKEDSKEDTYIYLSNYLTRLNFID